MTVAELVAELQRYPSELPVVWGSDPGWYLPVTAVRESAPVLPLWVELRGLRPSDGA